MSKEARDGTDRHPCCATRTATRTNAASAIDATKVYGSQDNEVIAVDYVTVDFATGRFSALARH
jgi:hypothetical protein